MANEATAQALEIREGDVFRFSYHDPRPNGFDLQWAFDGQLVMQNGKLTDTYWGFSGGDRRTFAPAEAQAKGTLTFVCNLNDVRDIRAEEQRYYDESDCFNLSYQSGCYKRFVVRKDAARSTGRMLTEVQAQMDKIKRDTEWQVKRALHETERLSALRTRIEAGDDSVYLSW